MVGGIFVWYLFFIRVCDFLSNLFMCFNGKFILNVDIVVLLGLLLLLVVIFGFDVDVEFFGWYVFLFVVGVVCLIFVGLFVLIN